MVKGKVGKERPRSSATKRKKAGSPDGSETPMDAGQLASLDSFQQPPIVDVIRGPAVEELLISETDMFAKRPQRRGTPPKTLKSIEVRKKHAISTVPIKTVSVLKKVNAALPDVAEQSAGPRFNSQGQILPHSILGGVEQYRQGANANGDMEAAAAPKPILIAPSLPAPPHPETKEGRALQNWERQLKEHARQVNQLAARTGKSQTSLLLSNTHHHRFKTEQRTIIDRAIPAMDGGKGYRVGSEFWNQAQQIGGPDSAIVMTLNESEQGKAPELEQIGQPLLDVDRPDSVYPWKRNKFFEQRRKELAGVLSEQQPHQPSFGGLFIEGRKELTSGNGKIEHRVGQEEEEILERNIPTPEVEQEATPSQGPILEIDGVECKWAKQACDPTVIRVLFNTDAGVISTQHLKLKNTGTTAIFYAWKCVPKENKLNTVMEGTNKQRFYFSINDGVILPGQELSVPLIFLTKQAGIYSECWQLVTRPLLNQGAPIIVSLKGVALRRDVYKKEKEKIEELLEKRQAQYNVRLLVEEMVRGVHSPPPPSPPPAPAPSLKQHFNRRNPHLSFQSDYYHESELLWRSIKGSTDTGDDIQCPMWNQTLSSLRKEILKLPQEEQVERMDQFNSLYGKMTQPRLQPTTEEAYDLCYGFLKSAVDALEAEDKALRTRMALPDRVHIEEPPAIEPDATSEKTESRQGQRDSLPSALISPAPDSKKGKKDADKKRDGKSSSKEKPRTVSKNSRGKSDQTLLQDEEETLEKKEWQEIADPDLKQKYQERLTVLANSLLTTCIDHISLGLEEELGKPF